MVSQASCTEVGSSTPHCSSPPPPTATHRQPACCGTHTSRRGGQVPLTEITPNICLLTFFLQEDPRLKFPVHMRSKASLNPNDLGPLPVSTLETHGPVWKCLLVHGPSVDREALWPSLSPDVLNPLGLSFLNRIGCMTELIAHSVHTTPSSSERGFWMADC